MTVDTIELRKKLAEARRGASELEKQIEELDQQMSWLKDAQDMFAVIASSHGERGNLDNDNANLPIFRPVKGNVSEYEVWDERPADDMQQALNSIGVWLYEQIMGESEWTDKQFTQYVLTQKKYQNLPEGHVFAELVDVLAKDDHPMTSEQVEAALAEILRQAQDDMIAYQYEKEELEARIAELESIIPSSPTHSEVAEESTGEDRDGAFAPVVIDDFEIPTRSVRGPRVERSEGNGHNVVAPNQSYLLSEVDLTPPQEAVEQLKAMFPNMNVIEWEQALQVGVAHALRGCEQAGVDPQRLAFFPWVKRVALARVGNVGERSHYGALIEQVVFPKLEQVYKEKHNLGFKNYRAGKMSSMNYLEMRQDVSDWLLQRESEVEGDICFSGAILDLFHGHSVNSSRYEVENTHPNLVLGTSYLLMQMLLTQSQLKTKWEELHFDMAADKYDHEGNSAASSSLCCVVDDSELGFNSVHADNAYTAYGAVVLPRPQPCGQ